MDSPRETFQSSDSGTQSSHSLKGTSVGVTVGSVGAGILTFLGLFFFLRWWTRRKGRKKHRDQPDLSGRTSDLAQQYIDLIGPQYAGSGSSSVAREAEQSMNGPVWI